MAFVKGTIVFTDSGFKPIEDISGRDRVLTRNFLGEAQFIQPFAIKKKKYKGEVVELGGKTWSLRTTPDHLIPYDPDDKYKGYKFDNIPAKDITCHEDNRIYRKFKYITPEDYKKETVVIFNEFGKRWSYVYPLDWFVLCGFVLARGYLEPAGRRRALNIYIKDRTKDQEVAILSDILDRIGVTWKLYPVRSQNRWLLRVSPNNTLASRLSKRLGSVKRRKMYIADSMIYNSSRELAYTLIDTIKTLTSDQFSTNNEKLVDSLVLLGTLWGYSTTKRVKTPKGYVTDWGAVNKTVYSVDFKPLPTSYSPRYKNILDYDDYVYEIYLFDGQIYIKNETSPIWINPK